MGFIGSYLELFGFIWIYLQINLSDFREFLEILRIFRGAANKFSKIGPDNSGKKL